MVKLAVNIFLGWFLCITQLSTHANEPDIEHGRQVVLDRETGHCLLCHQIQQLDALSQGNIGPPLSNIGNRYSADELKLRIATPQQFNPQTVMPAYFDVSKQHDVAPEFDGKTILTETELNQLVNYLMTLRMPADE